MAISLNHIVYVVPFDLTKLKTATGWTQLQDMKGEFTYGGPYQAPTKGVLWSSDGKKLAVATLSPVGGKQLDLIVVFDLSACSNAAPCNPAEPRLLDNFPGSRFTMKGYGTAGGQSTTIPSFDWDGLSLFLLNTIYRYQYGYLYTYNFGNKQVAQLTDPMGTSCCYSDARWSPDGSYFLFAYQDINQGNQARTQLFYISYGSLGTGSKYTPLPLPDGVLTNPQDQPEPALRTAR